MMRLAALGLATVLALPAAAWAESSGGSRQPAGGGHMSSYVSDPYHDPRSLHSQRMGTGQILGAPMLHDRAGPLVRTGGRPSGHWAVGSSRGRATR